MPIPSTPSQTISYPSLNMDSPTKKAQELYPSLSSVGPRTPTSGIPIPASVTTAKKAKPSASTDNSSVPMPGAFDAPKFGIPSSSDFTFDFSSGIGEYGRKMLDDIKDRAREIRAKMEPTPSTPAQQPQTPTGRAATTGRRKRFSDIHRRQFAKMESIANHYAAKRTKVTTPQNPQKGIKRTQSQAALEEKSLPPTPSPVKKQPEQDLESKRSKRTKIEPVSSFASKIGRITGTPKRTSKPPPSAARTAVARRVSNQKKPLPPLPRSAVEPSIRLVPSSVNGTRSKIPVTPSSKGAINVAPATVAAAPKFALSLIPQPGSPMPNTPGASPHKSITRTMSEAKPRVIKQLKKLGDMASKASDRMSGPRMGVLSPIKLTETVDLEDPFRSDRVPQSTKGWTFEPPSDCPTMPEFPQVPSHEPEERGSPRPITGRNAPLPSLPPVASGSKKRKGVDSATNQAEKDVQVKGESTQSPARKRLRFNGMNAEGMKDMKDNVMEKGRALLDKARLEFLATPKRIERIRGTKSTVRRSTRKPVWK
ncbi:hypothetical protein K440DRAFT_612282 [Wilcoxina mikolae CBS 423.85]|nr:hypothetical protein K440DRAFT_612282 [Wilcoxina mikolae CBS 423.85]